MNMRKKEYKLQKMSLALSPLAEKLLLLGGTPILLSLLYIAFNVAALPLLTLNAMQYYTAMLEYPIAAIAVLTVGTLLTDIAVKRSKH